MVAILGGGISGLTLAYYLQKAGVSYDLFEASSTPGGNLRTAKVDNYLLETGPNSLQLSPELQDLLTDLGLTDEIQETAAVSVNRYVLRHGRYQKLPSSPPALLASGFFSLKAKYNLLRELSRSPQPVNPDETLASFFHRRFGPEVVDYALNPFISGIYAGDPEQLLLHKTFPKLGELEQTYGSVVRGLAKSGSSSGRRRIISLRNGLQTLPATLASKLTNYHGNQQVTGLARAVDGSYQLELASEQAPRTYAAVVLALPTHAAAPLLKALYPEAAEALAAVYHPAMAAIYTAYRRADVSHPLDGFGALHPKVEQPYAAGSIWTSSIFPDRCPADQVLFTTFVGGSQYQEQAHQTAVEQQRAVHQELKRYYGIKAEAPLWQTRYYWEQAIPQFDHRIVAAHAAADALMADHIYTAANWRSGVGVPDCIRHARQLAEKITSNIPHFLYLTQ